MSLRQCPDPSSVIRSLLEWCKDNNVWIDPRLEVRRDSHSGIAIFSKDECIPPGTSVVHIHKGSVLSVRSCSLSAYVPGAAYGVEAQLALSLALYGEILQGKKSRWHGYLQSLPSGVVSLPIFWEHDDVGPKDGKEAARWLRGTEVKRILGRADTCNMLTLDEYYTTVAEPLLLHFEHDTGTAFVERPNVTGFYRAYSLVSSRAFLVDAFHGLSMIPIADAFNHTQDNHVHIESDFHVCPECGSLQECEHDREDMSDEFASFPSIPVRARDEASIKENVFDSYYEMVSNAFIPASTEVFNTYGEALTNAQLLCQYGFALDVNENDCLHWDLEEVHHVANGTEFTINRFRPVWEEMLENVDESVFHGASESQLVHYHSIRCDTLSINCDGKLSHRLWTLLALLTCPNSDLKSRPLWDNGDCARLTKTLKEMYDMQMILEQAVDREDVEMPEYDQILKLRMKDMARLVARLCTARRRGIGKDEDEDVFDILDVCIYSVDIGACAAPHVVPKSLDAESCRMHDALLIVLSERSILDSCAARWVEVAGYL